MSTIRTPSISIMRDTGAWRMQVWISFAIAIILCGTGLSYLPGEALERAFMMMGYIFCLLMVLVLSKSIRDTHKAEVSGGVETPMWRFVAWGGFITAMGLTAWGLSNMAINDTYRAFLGVSWLYLVTSAFTLSKTLRDGHEADLMQAQLDAEDRTVQRTQVSSRPAAAPVANNA